MTTPTRPTAAKKTATPKAAPAGPAPTAAPASTSKSLEHHLTTVAEGDVMGPTALYEWLESLRALTSGLSFMVHAAASQLEAAARQGARQSTDGRLTLRQKVDMARVLRQMGRRLDNGAAEDLLTCASNAVKTYSLMQDFLESLESDTVSRPHRSSRGGFDLGK